MHELSIAQSILSIAEKAAPPDGIISGVNIQVGELSSIEIEALQFAFKAIKEDTLLQKAELNIEIIPGEAKCQHCAAVFHLSSYGNACPQCGDYALKITKGREMKVLSITIDEK